MEYKEIMILLGLVSLSLIAILLLFSFLVSLMKEIKNIFFSGEPKIKGRIYYHKTEEADKYRFSVVVDDTGKIYHSKTLNTKRQLYKELEILLTKINKEEVK